MGEKGQRSRSYVPMSCRIYAALLDFTVRDIDTRSAMLCSGRLAQQLKAVALASRPCASVTISK